ncbi:MAG: dihydropteroate synthase [Frankiaceae bacterium]|nr:dihydropteroate synthase [Frankiaceae bacterium]
MSATYPIVRGLPTLDRCRVMGVVNVTPDSFSDGGAFADADSAVKHGLQLWAEGADLIDVGGESTRPGATRVAPAEEQARVEPVVAALAAAGAMVSIDTMHASTARVALRAGASVVNDVSGGLVDPDLPRVVADAGVPYVVMHWRGHSDHMQERASYTDVVAEVRAALSARLDALVAAGLAAEQIVLDPGIGFAKDAEHNWALLAHLDALLDLGRPLLVGVSRKSFLGALLADDAEPRAVVDRDDATAALSALVAAGGAWCVRVHEVRASADAVRVAARLRTERSS